MPAKFPVIEIDYFVIMPNHFHGIIVIKGEKEGARTGVPLLGTSQKLTIGSTQINHEGTVDQLKEKQDIVQYKGTAIYSAVPLFL